MRPGVHTTMSGRLCRSTACACSGSPPTTKQHVIDVYYMKRLDGWYLGELRGDGVHLLGQFARGSDDEHANQVLRVVFITRL